MINLSNFLVALVLGLILGGFTNAMFEFLTQKRISFSTRFTFKNATTVKKAIANLFLAIILTFTGPLILFRNGYRGLLQGRHPGYVAAGFTIAGLWGMACGFVIMSMLLRLA